MEQQQVQNEPQPNQEISSTPEKPTFQEPSIVERVSKQSDTTPGVSVKPPEDSDFKFNYNDIEKITDPQAKEYAQQAYKSFQSGFNKKFEELASLRKELEQKEQEYSSWTPEKIQALLKDPSFVQAAQSATRQNAPNPTGGELTDTEWSALTETEKQQFVDVQNKVNSLVAQNNELLRSQQHDKLKTKYANYDSGAVDRMTNDLLVGKYQATVEDIWKVMDYNKAIERAYELGLQDKKLSQQDKLQATSPEGLSVTGGDSIPPKEQNESNHDYFVRLANRRLRESQQRQLQR
jgi:hypothetical protein